MKIGDYVRTENGEIGKLINCPKQLKESYGKWLWFETSVEQRPINKEDIIKSSPDIIDLIEDGDIIHYHNEYIDFISPIIIYDDGEIASNLYDSDGYIFLDKEKDKNNIKSIITHEQFESMKYKVAK